MLSWFPRLRLAQRRTVWCPTLVGTFCILTLLAIPTVWWFICGESFLSLTQRVPADVLVVEGWIGFDGLSAAEEEFEKRGYEYIVAAGGLKSSLWQVGSSNYAEMAGRELLRLGIPKDKIIVAAARDTENQRTHESAVAVWRALQARGVHPKTLTVFTLGPHARRSRLVFAKVEGPGTQVGVLSWVPSDYKTMPWWRSSERAKELITETAGYVYEALLNSGRIWDSRDDRAENISQVPSDLTDQLLMTKARPR
jgi:hypothetical protein